MEETREKIELFRNYYLVCFRSFDQDPYSPTYLEPLNMYIIVFREGILSFHFRPTPHPQNVRRRIKQLKDYIAVTSDWISYALIDDITDAFGPLIQGIEYEVDSIDELVLILKEAEQSDMLRRIGTCRKKVMGLLRLMGNKADVVKGLAKRCNENWRVAPTSDIDHLITMTQNLNHYEKILSRSHSNYLAQISIEMTEANNQINDVLSKLTALGTVLIPMNLVTGLWGMNVHVPGEDDQTTYVWFISIVACLAGFALIGGYSTYPHTIALAYVNPHLATKTLHPNTAYGTFTRVSALSATPTSSTPPPSSPTLKVTTTRVLQRDIQPLSHHAMPMDDPDPIFPTFTDRLSLIVNWRNIKSKASSFLSDALVSAKEFIQSLEFHTISNLMLRASVRSLTDQEFLLDAESWANDLTATLFLQEYSSRPPSNESAASISVIPPRPATSIREVIARTDASAAIALALRLTVWYLLPPDLQFDTVTLMNWLDILFQMSLRAPSTPFYRLGDIVESLDPALPPLPALTIGSGQLCDLPRVGPSQDFVSRPSFPRPPLSVIMEEEEPVATALYMEVRYTATKTTASVHQDDPLRKRPWDLSGFVIFEASKDSSLRQIVCFFLAVLASGGLVHLLHTRSDAILRKEQLRQDNILVDAKRSFMYLSWQLRQSLLAKLRVDCDIVALPTDYAIPPNPGWSSDRLCEHAEKLFNALSSSKRRVDCLLTLRLMTRPLQAPSTPEATDDSSSSRPNAESTSSTAHAPSTPEATDDSSSSRPNAEPASSTSQTPTTSEATDGSSSAHPNAESTSSTSHAPSTPEAMDDSSSSRPNAEPASSPPQAPSTLKAADGSSTSHPNAESISSTSSTTEKAPSGPSRGRRR
ncbi:hypothetical protein H0H93_016620 [Arthromyces matolae]|nr:hypothetical protein H0H93_016620 [Arthromyces matolae]